jgi:hypothetical protein
MIISAPRGYREAARHCLPPFAFDRIEGGACAAHTLRYSVDDLSGASLATEERDV